MRRIDTSTAVPDLHGPGKPGFRDGNKALAIPPTDLNAAFFNSLQEENANVVEAAGLTLDPDDNTQLLQAMRIILSNADLIARFTTTGNIALNGLGVQAGGDWPANLTANDFILVKDQATAANNGWYRAQAGAWTRVVYLDEDNEVSAGLLTKVSEGATLADSIWMLTTDAPIDVGTTALNFGRKDSFSGVRHYTAGSALPTTNIGPIWHDDYNSIMTWQAFTANGATYTGYASVMVGNLLMDTQPTPRVGYVKSGTATLNRTTYAALRGWAMHNGIMVASGVWAAGSIAVCDNLDGTTFKIFDVRGEFPRYWDDGRGIDSARAFGSKQNGTMIAGDLDGIAGYSTCGGVLPAQPSTDRSLVGWDIPQNDEYLSTNIVAFGSAASSTSSFLSNPTYFGVTRPRNVALLASIKF